MTSHLDDSLGPSLSEGFVMVPSASASSSRSAPGDARTLEKKVFFFHGKAFFLVLNWFLESPPLR